MSSNFRDLKIETKDGKILNVSSLCDAIKNTKIEDDTDLYYLETLCNKLANDDYNENLYTNEHPIVDVLHEKLLKYYINEMDFTLDDSLEILKVYNKDFNDIHKIEYNNTSYLLYDKKDDIRLLSFKSDQDLLDIIKNNTGMFVKNNIKLIFDQQYKNIKEVVFKEDNDKELLDYNETFDVGDTLYKGIDINNNNLYKIKNGLYVKDNNNLLTLFAPTLTNDELYKEKRKVNGFDIDDFYVLSDKFKNNDYMEEDEIKRLYHEVKYLIDTMHRRKSDDELTEALNDYMDNLIKIYDNYPDGLTKDDIDNIKEYNKNNGRKAA